MTSRERRLIFLLGVFLIGGGAFAGYSLIYSPIKAAKVDADKLENDLSLKNAMMAKIIKDKPRVEAAKRRSLPADANAARGEYDAMMRQLLIQSGISPGMFIVTQRESVDAKNVPILDARTKKAAYQRLGFEIRIKRIDVGTLAAFLQRYYRLNLLHQITYIEVIRKDQDGVGSRFRTGGERADLEVQFHIDAIILDGAENRKTLLPMPVGAGAVGGAAGFMALMHTPEAGRGVSPLQYADVLAGANQPREYKLITAKDFFHGPLPPPAAPPPPRGPEVAKAPPPPKEDISPFIRLTGITRRSDGTIQADVWDAANKQDYQVDLKPKGERFEVKVKKYYYLKDQRKFLDGWAELVIQEDNTTTNRKFKVVGVCDDGLVLTEPKTLADANGEEKPEAPKPKFGGKDRDKPNLPAASPPAAVVGGVAAALAPAGEKVFVWRVGQPLKALTELTAKEADDALRRAAPAYTASDPPPTTPVSKADE